MNYSSAKFLQARSNAAVKITVSDLTYSHTLSAAVGDANGTITSATE